jgi:hypothetical protein
MKYAASDISESQRDDYSTAILGLVVDEREREREEENATRNGLRG